MKKYIAPSLKIYTLMAHPILSISDTYQYEEGDGLVKENVELPGEDKTPSSLWSDEW